MICVIFECNCISCHPHFLPFQRTYTSIRLFIYLLRSCFMFKSALFGFLFVASIVIAIDLYAWQGVKLLTASWSPKSKSILKWSYWGWTTAGFLFFLFFRMGGVEVSQTTLRIVSSVVFSIFFAKLFWCLFLFLDDATRLFRWVYGLVAKKPEEVVAEGGITRYKFLSWMGLGVGA